MIYFNLVFYWTQLVNVMHHENILNIPFSIVRNLLFQSSNSKTVCHRLLFCVARLKYFRRLSPLTSNILFLFVIFLLVIVLSVLLRFTDSDYPFGIFKLFLNIVVRAKNCNSCIRLQTLLIQNSSVHHCSIKRAI